MEDADPEAELEPEAEYEAGIAERLPRKRVAAGAIVRDAAGRLLMVEPLYKPTWEIPGGVVEADESPLDGCRREIREELGLDLPLTRLLIVDWVPRRGVWHDCVLFVFSGGVVTPAQVEAVRPPAHELAGARLVTLDEAAAHVRPSMAARLRSAVAVLDEGSGPAYLHRGRRVL